MIDPRGAAAAIVLTLAALVAGCTTAEPSGLPSLGSVAVSTEATSGGPVPPSTSSASGTSNASGTAQASGTVPASPDATLPEATPVADDPTAVVIAFADDYLTMLSNSGDPALRRSQWAGPAGLAKMVAEGELAAADQITATGTWQVRVDEVEAVEMFAVVSGCIDVSQMQPFQAGEPAPFPGDFLAFSADVDRSQGAWLVTNFSIPGPACPDA